MKELWKRVTAWCSECQIEVKAMREAKCKMKNGEIKIGAVCQCNNIIDKKTKQQCGKKYFSWLR